MFHCVALNCLKTMFYNRGNVFELLLVLVMNILIKKSFPMRADICKSRIYCQGDLLRVVQMAGIFKDSKTFVDMSLTKSPKITLRAFDLMMAKTHHRPSKEDVVEFVSAHFQASYSELEHWFPADFQVNPPFLRKIKDEKIRHFAKYLSDIWPHLGRKVKPEVMQNPVRYSIIPIPHGFIVPGGRFREFYYWDTYWIVKGLLVCNMKNTAKGILENFFAVVDRYGFIPNGGRIYYLDRSQPPLLTMMVGEFVKESNELMWLKKNLKYLEQELRYWLNNKTVELTKGGQKYHLARYISFEDSPRPESYIEDIHTAARYRTEEQKRLCYTNIRTGAESGWDFSGRWFFDRQGGNRGDLSTTNPTRVLPVDLNAFLCKSFKILSDFYSRFKDKRKAKFWKQKWEDWTRSIREVLYNEEDGIWYDYDLHLKVQRKHFYPSNFAPLWTECHDGVNSERYGRNATDYLKKKGITKFSGGIPTSLFETGEQWDLPNAWAPLQGLVIFGLEQSRDAEAQKLARELGIRWINSLMKVAEDTNELFEKYNAQFYGMYGGGGEYEVQTGFGWTNGVMLELIEHFYIKSRKNVET